MPETHANGMDIAPDVLDTIVALALKDVEGIASVGVVSPKIFSLFGAKQELQGVTVEQISDDTIDVTVVITVIDGVSLNQIASDARSAIADAILSQTGYTVGRIDIHVDGIVFQDQ